MFFDWYSYHRERILAIWGQSYDNIISPPIKFDNNIIIFEKKQKS